MKIARILVFAVLAALAAISTPCQTPSALNHFSIAGSAVGFSSAATGAQAATLTGVSYQLTSTVSVGYQNLNVPSVTSYDFGVAQYARPLSSLLGKKLTSKLTFNASSVTVSFLGGAGEVMTPAKHIAETAGILLSFPMATSSTGVSVFPVFGFQWVHSPGVNGFITQPSTAAISAGLGINF